MSRINRSAVRIPALCVILQGVAKRQDGNLPWRHAFYPTKDYKLGRNHSCSSQDYCKSSLASSFFAALIQWQMWINVCEMCSAFIYLNKLTPSEEHHPHWNRMTSILHWEKNHADDKRPTIIIIIQPNLKVKSFIFLPHILTQITWWMFF